MNSRRPKMHVDVFFTCMGQTYAVGHGDVEQSDTVADQGGMIASLLHQLAWEYEEKARAQKDESSEDRPRKVITRAGDEFYEVAPDEFVAGMSWEDATDTYEKFGGASTFEQLKNAFPGIRWEYV